MCSEVLRFGHNLFNDRRPELLNCATQATFGADINTKMREIERPNIRASTPSLLALLQ